MRTLLPVLLVLSVTSSCGGATDERAVRLIDRFTAGVVSGTPAVGDVPDGIAWEFGGEPAQVAEHAETWGWQAGPDVDGLVVRDGTLAGTASGDFPVLMVERTGEVDERDGLHALEIRLRVSGGENLWVSFAGGDSVNLDGAQQQMSASLGLLTTPLRAGETFETYTILPPQNVGMSNVRHVLLRPTDAADATFEIEHMRAISRKAHLATVASGIGWQGLAEIYHESLVARSPETLSFAVDLPPSPWLDLTLGTPEDGPVTFHVDVRAGGTDSHLIEQTVTTPHRWERRQIDLGDFAGQSVTVALSLTAESDGMLGFWGSPVVRAGHAATAAPANGPFGARPQGVILVQADTLRSDHLNVYGYERPTAPILNVLAGEGVLFRNTTAQATWTKVSTPSIMTSLYPLTHGVRTFGDRLPTAATTLAELYRDAGYATLALSSVLFTGQFTNLHQGFEELHESGSAANPGPKTAREYVDRVSEWLEVHRDGPFFIYLHVFDPHDPYEPYRPYHGLWADPAHKEEHEAQLDEVREVIDDTLRRNFGMPSRAELEEVEIDPDAFIAYDEGWYDGSIRAMDVEMGRLVEQLRGLGLDDRTLLVFMSDHGEEFLDHGNMFHGQTVYGELTRVPLIMRWPGGLEGGVVVDEHTQLIDIYPTLVEISGLAAVEEAQGQSLTPLLGAGDPAAWIARPVFSEKAITDDTFSPPPRDTESYAVTEGQWKLIHNRVRPDGAPEFELYDAHADPLDMNDVAADNPDVVERLAREIERWHRVAETARLPDDAESTAGLTQDQLERLRRLGYIRE